MTGKFVTIEGCEGVGKSTQVRKLKEYLSLRGIEAVFTREPGGTPVSEQIRGVILNPENKDMDDVTELLHAVSTLSVLLSPSLKAVISYFATDMSILLPLTKDMPADWEPKKWKDLTLLPSATLK